MVEVARRKPAASPPPLVGLLVWTATPEEKAKAPDRGGWMDMRDRPHVERSLRVTAGADGGVRRSPDRERLAGIRRLCEPAELRTRAQDGDSLCPVEEIDAVGRAVGTYRLEEGRLVRTGPWLVERARNSLAGSVRASVAREA